MTDGNWTITENNDDPDLPFTEVEFTGDDAETLHNENIALKAIIQAQQEQIEKLMELVHAYERNAAETVEQVKRLTERIKADRVTPQQKWEVRQ